MTAVIDAPALEVLVCTFGARVGALAQRLPAPDPRVRFLVSHQCPEPDIPIPTALTARADVRYLRHPDRGLSVNRNHALRAAVGEVCLIADDDLDYLPGWVDAILEPFARPGAPDFASFVLVDADGRPRIPDYPRTEVAHDRRTIYKVCSCEIAVRLDSVRRTRVTFDPNLGVGGAIGLGEELVFLRDLLESGLDGRWVPHPIARHADETTGTRLARRADTSLAHAVGAMAWCRRGAFAYPFVLKEAVRLGIGAGSLAAVPRMGAAWWSGLVEARRLGLGPGRVARQRARASLR